MINRFTLLLLFVLGVIASRVMATPVPFVAFVATILFALPALLALYKTTNAKTTATVFFSLALFALIVEEIAVATGIPYSEFAYSELLGSTAINVPLATPISFFALALGAWALAAGVRRRPIVDRTRNTVHGTRKTEHSAQKTEDRRQKTARRLQSTADRNQKLLLAITGGLILVAIDLILDPAATALGLWIWDNPGLYYGIPTVNFLGWFLVGSVSTLILTYILPKPHITLSHSIQLILAYWVGVNAGLGLMIPAALGAVMSVLMFHWYRNTTQHN